MTVTIDDGDGGATGEDLLDALEEARVFSVRKMKDGRLRVQESCDRFFSANLTKDQVLALADELRALAYGQRDDAPNDLIVTVKLDPKTIKWAMEMGSGNLSDGIRDAVYESYLDFGMES